MEMLRYSGMKQKIQRLIIIRQNNTSTFSSVTQIKGVERKASQSINIKITVNPKEKKKNQQPWTYRDSEAGMAETGGARRVLHLKRWKKRRFVRKEHTICKLVTREGLSRCGSASADAKSRYFSPRKSLRLSRSETKVVESFTLDQYWKHSIPRRVEDSFPLRARSSFNLHEIIMLNMPFSSSHETFHVFFIASRVTSVIFNFGTDLSTFWFFTSKGRTTPFRNGIPEQWFRLIKYLF